MMVEDKPWEINDFKDLKYLYISPRIIQNGAKLVNDEESLELYKKIEENTIKFAEKLIVDLASSAYYKRQEVEDYLKLKLIFCGDFDDLADKSLNSIDLIFDNKDKIIALYNYAKNSEFKHFFECFPQTETINDHGYIYISFSRLLEEFDKNNIDYEIDINVDRYASLLNKDAMSTIFVIKYNPIKENKNDESIKLKKEKRYRD